MGARAAVTRLAEKVLFLRMRSLVSLSPPMHAMTPSSVFQT